MKKIFTTVFVATLATLPVWAENEEVQEINMPAEERIETSEFEPNGTPGAGFITDLVNNSLESALQSAAPAPAGKAQLGRKLTDYASAPKFGGYFIGKYAYSDQDGAKGGAGFSQRLIRVYVDGTILSDTDVVSYNQLSVAALKKIHNSDLKFKDYNAFKRLDDYERYCREMGFTHPKEYIALRQKLNEMQRAHADVKKVPCHCDYQPTNLVLSGDKLYVLDWEFAGMNDPFYDIACYGNAGFDKALSLLEAYVEHTPTREELQRLYFHRSFQCLQWYNVAIFKDRVGLSRDLNMDFNEVAAFFFNMAKDLANE